MRSVVKIIFCLGLFSYQAALGESLDLGLKIRFDTGISEIQFEEDLIAVDELVQIHKDYPNSEIHFIGHTDYVGTKETNRELSEARALSVKEAFLQKNDAVIKVKSQGELNPIADNKIKKGRARNRRVTVSIHNLEAEEVSTIREFVKQSSGLYILSSSKNTKTQAYKKKKVPVYGVVSSEGKGEENPHSKQVQETNEESLQGSKGRYAIGFLPSYTFLEAKDIKGPNSGVNADWVSELNYDLTLEYQYKIKDQYWVGVQGGVDIQSYEDQENPNYIWDREDPVLYNVGLVFDYETNKVGLGLNLVAFQQAFVFENQERISLEKEWLYSVVGEVKYLIFTYGDLRSRVGLDLTVPIMSSGDLNAKGNPGGVTVRYDLSRKIFRSHEFLIGAFYSYYNFDHDRNKQSTQRLGMELSLRNLQWL